MNHKPVLKTETIYLIIYNMEDFDRDLLGSLIDISHEKLARVFHHKKTLIDKVSFTQFSKAQKLLLCLFLHLYAALHSRNILTDSRLKNIRKRMCVSDDFAGMAFQSMKQLKPDKILNGRGAIESIIKPTNEIISWGANFVFEACMDGRFVEKAVIRALHPREYEHPFDRQALDALEGTPGLETLVRKFNEYGIDRLMKVRYAGSNIKVTENNFPQLYRNLATVCDILNLHPLPDLYIELGFINGMTMGVENPIIVLTSGCVGLLSYDELLFVLGHEVGHIKSQHLLYHQMASVLPIVGGVIASASLGLGGLVTTALQVALLNWQRKSEFSGDRAGLLACQNVDAASTAMMKIAGVPPKYYKLIDPDDFQTQAREFEELDTDNLDKIAKAVSVMFADHPWTVMRARELYKWVDSREYGQIIDQSCGVETKDTKCIRFCTKCGHKFDSDESFCKKCGHNR